MVYYSVKIFTKSGTWLSRDDFTNFYHFYGFFSFFNTVCTFVCDNLETSRDMRNSFRTSKECLWYIVLLKYQLNLTLDHSVMTLQTLTIFKDFSVFSILCVLFWYISSLITTGL